MNTTRDVLGKKLQSNKLIQMKDKQDIFIATAKTLSQNPKIKINFKRKVTKQPKNSDENEIDLDDKKIIQRGTLDFSSFFDRYLRKLPYTNHEPKQPHLKNLYKYLHYARAHYFAILEFPGVLLNLKEFNKTLLNRKISTKDNPEDLFYYLIYLFCLNKFLKTDISSKLPQNFNFTLFLKKHSRSVTDLSVKLQNHDQFSKISKTICESILNNEIDKSTKNEDNNVLDPNKDLLKKEKGLKQKITNDVKKFYFKKETNDSKIKNKSESEKNSSTKKNRNSNQQGYKFFTNKFDRIVSAEKLCNNNELTELRRRLLEEFPKLDHIVRKLAAKLEKKLLSKQTRSWDINLEEGVLDVSKLSNRIIDPFNDLIYKKEKESSAKNTIVTLLIDNSGSMRGRPIITAVNAVEVLSKTLEKCGVKIEILGFTTREWKGGQSRKLWKENSETQNPGRLNDLLHIIYKDSERNWKSSNKNLGLVLKEGLLKENIDGEALLWAERRLSNRSEKKKILIVVSDGAPVDDSTLSANESNILERHLKEVISKIEKKKNIDLLAIGIGHDVSKYYSKAVTIEDANKLAEVMLQKLTGIFSEN